MKENYKVIATDLCKLKALDTDLGAIQQVNLIGNLDRAGNITMFFILEELKRAISNSSQGT